MNQYAIDFIREHEGCKLTAYADLGGVCTIGFGSTGSDIKPGLTWTQQQADSRLAVDVAKMETAVLKLLKRKLSPQSIAALDSFAYNLGPSALETSHLLQCINNGDDIGAAKSFLAWDHVGKQEVKGLLIRRLEEAALYLKGF